MGPSRISRAGLSLLLFCALVGGGIGVAGLAVGSDWADVAGQTTSTADHADGTPEDGDSGRAAEGADGTDGTDADVEPRDPSDFEERDAAEGSGNDGPNAPDGSDGADADSGDDAPGVEARSRSRMPTRGPERGTIVVSFDDVPVTTISFSRRQYGNVTVEVLDGLPPDVQPPAGDRLRTFRITVPDELRDGPAKVAFTVDVATLESRDVPDGAVWLAHHDPDTGEWDRLETHPVHASEERVAYAANTTGFSLFAIQGDASRARTPSPTEPANGSGPGASNVTAAEEAEAAFVGGFGFPMAVLLFMGAVSVVTTVFGARRLSSVDARAEN